VSAETEDAVRDLAIWYMENRNRIPAGNLQKKCEFQDKAIKCLIEIVALQAKDIQRLEQRKARPRLWLPSSVSIDNAAPIRLRD
jgi:hypothetical protein